MRELTICILCFIGCGLANAQKSAVPTQPATQKRQAANEKASEAQVLKLLDMLQIRDNLKITLDAMKTQMQHGSEQMLREKIARPTDEQVKSVDKIVDEEFAKISMDDLVRDVVPIYQRHLTRSDVAALIAFYSSPVGLKLRREQPAMMKESMEATSAGQREKMEQLLARVEIRLEQFIETEQGKP